MSVLQFPRLYFRGEISWDPGLANNDENLFDAENVKLLFHPDAPANEIKNSIISNLRDYGIWNYYGTHDATFENVTITGGINGPQQTVISGDPIIGKQLGFRGKLVDLDAASGSSSRIFFDSLTLGDPPLGLGFKALKSERMFARWINFYRNLSLLPIAGIAAAVWQTVFDKEQIMNLRTTDSPLLQALATSFERDNVKGLMIRFHTYRTLYFQNGIRNTIPHEPRDLDQLNSLYQQGLNFSNPAYSTLVGVLGLWEQSDTTSAPSGRLLTAVNNVATARRMRRRDRVVVDVPAPLGPTVIEFDESNKLMFVDLGAAIPELDGEMEKVNLGTLVVQLQYQGNTILIATIPYSEYNKSKYETTAGIVQLDLSTHPDTDIFNKINNGNLEILCSIGSEEVRALGENQYVAITEARDIYLDEAEVKQIRIKVFYKGNPAPSNTGVIVSEYSRSGERIGTIATLNCNETGIAELTLTAQRPGLLTYGLLPYSLSQEVPEPPTALDPTNHYYINVRTLPFDNSLEQATPNEQLTWSFIYKEILKVYDVLNPVMSRQGINIPLNDRNRMRTLAQTIKNAVSKQTFEDFNHMPVTRDMSEGKRRILQRWCDLVLNGEDPVESEETLDAILNRRLPQDPRRAL